MPDGDRETTPADRRVTALVAELRQEPAEPPARLTQDVMRTARWQHLARGSLLVTTQLVGALSDGVLLALDDRRRRRPR